MQAQSQPISLSQHFFRGGLPPQETTPQPVTHVSGISFVAPARKLYPAYTPKPPNFDKKQED